MMTPQEFAEKQARRLKGSLEDVRAGVQRVEVSPTELAAQKQDKYLAGVQQAAQDGKWARGLRRVTKQDWQEKMLSKGVNRIAQGIDEAKDKVTEFAAEFLPHVAAGAAQVSKMPDLTLEDSIARMTQMVRHNAKFRRS